MDAGERVAFLLRARSGHLVGVDIVAVLSDTGRPTAGGVAARPVLARSGRVATRLAS